MNLRSIGLSTGAVLSAFTLGACGAYQQDPQCVVAKGSFITVYTPKPGQDTSQACAQLKPAVVGLEKYFSEDPSARDTVAIRTQRMGDELAHKDTQVDPDAPRQPNSVGELTTDAPGSDNFCEVPSLGTARLESRYSGISKAPLSLVYEWSNLRIYNTPGIPGTQFTAELRYTENGCTADYTVKGIWPVVSCATNGQPDETKCDPKPNPAAGRNRGSGINPVFPVKCDPDVKICVLTGEVPSDKP
ncbi:hypothetical protein JRI60_40865 [Archangium violaceum]|uniref:hypothetical protein n=1 Tax=Archangium violaceum TaxID=83451 RepID=UPI0019512954|nr:hypothetical protein [Archangium violaceum]QRN95367.1 hypothetical protein JRI60_40865 [Archangium violaceum]